MSKFKNTTIQVNPMDCIIEPSQFSGAVWLGSIDAASSKVLITQNNIGAILTICPQQISPAIKSLLEMYLQIPAVDIETFDLSKYFTQCFQFIDKARKITNVLIHCMAGVSRSATIMIGYLAYKNNITIKAAFEITQQKRWQITPNNGFLKQLDDFERKTIIEKDSQVKQRFMKLESERNQRVNSLKHLPTDIPRKELNQIENDLKNAQQLKNGLKQMLIPNNTYRNPLKNSSEHISSQEQQQKKSLNDWMEEQNKKEVASILERTQQIINQSKVKKNHQQNASGEFKRIGYSQQFLRKDSGSIRQQLEIKFNQLLVESNNLSKMSYLEQPRNQFY